MLLLPSVVFPFFGAKPMELEGKHILIVSNEQWGDVWYSKHNYAHELAKHNRVIFVDPTTKWKFANILRPRCTLRGISENLSVLRYRNRLPSVNDAFFALNNAWVSHDLRKFLLKLCFPVDLFLTFDPVRLYDPARLGAASSLFIAVDDYDFTLRGEKHLYKKVDRIITIDERISRKFTRFNKPMLTISHAISSEEFAAPPIDMQHSGYGLYIGAIDKRVDLGLLRSMAEQHPDIPFLIIGRSTLKGAHDAQQLIRGDRGANIHYLGTKPFKELKSYIAAARFCIAPMDISQPGNDISHHKIFQYLAFGKPTFSTVFSAYRPLDHLMTMDNDSRELLAALARFIAQGEDPAWNHAPIAFSRTKTYEATFERIARFLTEPLAAKSTGR